jgi:heat shock protein HslJ
MNKHFRSTLALACLSLMLVVVAACVPIPPAVEPVAAPTATPSNTITNIVWQWTSVTTKPTGETTTVADPQNYTITFLDDGTLSGKADCNSFTGTYAQEGGFTITLGASTMAYCGEASLDQQYLELLSAVVAGGPDGQGNLALENAGGEKRMLFVNGGAAGSTAPTPAPTPAPAPSSDITDIVWKWQTLEDVAAGASTRVPDPSKYTIVFRTDGTTTGQADCNTFSGTYSQANGFTISVTPDVMAACDQGSMDQQFLNLLDDVAAGGPDGAGGLMLQTAGGAQKLLFSNGGAAQ